MKIYVAFAAIALVAGEAIAAPKIDVQGLILGSETARYMKGVPTLDLQQQLGAVQIRFWGWDHGNAVFALAFHNMGSEPVNVGLENIHATADGRQLRIFTVDELARQARNRATWRKIGLAFLGGLGAAAAASQRSHYSGSVTTPYGGMYRYSGSYPSLYGQLQADRISANTVAGMALIQHQLDVTIDAIGDRVLQTTTVDPGMYFGGIVIVEKLDYGKAPLEFRLDADWNGERYQFGYLLVRKGKPVPEEYGARLASRAKPGVSLNPAPVSTSAPGSAATPAAVQNTARAIQLGSGAVKMPAQTPSGYCLRTPPGYAATGSASAPLLTKSLPRCTVETSN